LIEPEGTKAGEEVGDEYVERYICMWCHWMSQSTTREEAIAAISPYVASKREGIFLDMLNMLLKCLPDEIKNIHKFMEQGNGDYDRIFEELRVYIRDKERAQDEKYAITTAKSSLSAAAAVTKDGPSVEYGMVELDVDKEVYGEDDYMPPPDASGNKRRMMTRSNSKSTVVSPDE
jgi:hypothetical protein